METPDKLLLDTHAFLWAVLEPERLGRRLQGWLHNAAGRPVVSVVSFWEISLLLQKGRLASARGLELFTDQGLADVDANLLPLRAEHVRVFHSLPAHHKDSFDRMLVAQALSEGAALATRDETIRRNYAVQVLW